VACAKASRPDEGSAMPPDADDDLASDRALADAIIRDAFRRDADRVVAVVAEVIERLKAKRGYSAQELEAAARALLEELSAGPTEVIDKRLRRFEGGQ
jgi:hydrogenase maturation factor HypF (carbamoyltransferase family)